MQHAHRFFPCLALLLLSAGCGRALVGGAQAPEGDAGVIVETECPIRIGILAWELPGDEGTVYQSVQEQWVRLAVDNVNSLGGIKGCRVETLYFGRHFGTQRPTRRAFEGFIDEGVTFVVGPEWNLAAFAAAEVAEANRVPNISANAALVPGFEELGDDGERWAYALGNTPLAILEQQVKAVPHLDCSTAMIVSEFEEGFEVFTQEAFQTEIERAGGTVVFSDTWVPGQPFDRFYDQFADGSVPVPECLFSSIAPDNVTRFLENWSRSGVALPAKIIHLNGLNFNTASSFADPDFTTGHYFITGEDYIAYPDERPLHVRNIVAEWENRYGEWGTSAAELAGYYDMTMIALLAMLDAPSLAPDDIRLSIEPVTRAERTGATVVPISGGPNSLEEAIAALESGLEVDYIGILFDITLRDGHGTFPRFLRRVVSGATYSTEVIALL